MTGQVGSVLAVVAVLAALAGAVLAVIRAAGPARDRHRDAAGHLRRVAHRRAGRRAAAFRAHRGVRGQGRRHLRTLVGAVGLTIADDERCLAFDGRGGHHADQFSAAARRALGTHRSVVLNAVDLPCDRVDCVVRGAVVAPLSGPAGGATAALVAVADDQPAPGLVQATLETARWAGSQLALHELDSSRERLPGPRCGRCGRRSARTSSTTR